MFEILIILKCEYGRLAHLIDSYPRKWRNGYNSQIIEDKVYFFIYESYNEFRIIAVEYIIMIDEDY